MVGAVIDISKGETYSYAEFDSSSTVVHSLGGSVSCNENVFVVVMVIRDSAALSHQETVEGNWSAAADIMTLSYGDGTRTIALTGRRIH